MAHSSMLHVRVDDEIKTQASEALAAMGLSPSQLVWIRSSRSADALWAAEQVLRSGSCGALLFWRLRRFPPSGGRPFETQCRNACKAMPWRP